MAHLAELILELNPEHGGKKTQPPDQLVLRYRRSKVVLKGWRLELLAGPLMPAALRAFTPKNTLAP